ncbi:MAG: toll/interleukin-1 receptor domain-containing protein [Chloroflexi bacterium]|nr:toll/interleukin-1 receptor domain-containing protein [Chloroflexota bacterium]
MANREHVAVLKQGVTAWNAWRAEHPAIVPDLSAAFLRRRVLEGIDLGGATLYETNLRRAVLKNANFAHARLGGADLSGANLRQANLRGAVLNGANLNRVDLAGANLSRAHLGFTVLGDVDLSRTHGLKSVLHENPSTIGIDTIYRSGGKIPQEFLRGCGVPDAMLELAASLVGQAIRYHSCFISYATPDERFARRLHDDLQMNGVRVWFAPDDLKTGEWIEDSITDAIRTFDKLILVLSQNSIDRAWVKKEFMTALDKEKRENRLVLFPIRLDDAVFETTEQWAYDVRKRHIGDFRNWTNPLLYQKAINRLLRDLNAGT